MPLHKLIDPFPWVRYSKKLIQKIDSPRNGGIFREKEAEERGMKLAIGSEGHIEDGNAVTLYWLVDKEDGVIVDAKFQLFGQSALIGQRRSLAIF